MKSRRLSVRIVAGSRRCGECRFLKWTQYGYYKCKLFPYLEGSDENPKRAKKCLKCEIQDGG